MYGAGADLIRSEPESAPGPRTSGAPQKKWRLRNTGMWYTQKTENRTKKTLKTVPSRNISSYTKFNMKNLYSKQKSEKDTGTYYAVLRSRHFFWQLQHRTSEVPEPLKS